MIIYPIIPIWIMSIICVVLVLIISIKGRRGWSLVRQIAIVVLMFVINIRPMVFSSNKKALSNDFDVTFVFDNTLSMLAEDYSGNQRRIDGAKKDCNYIMQELAGSNFSLIMFNNEARIAVPYTTDTNIISESLEVSPDMTTLYARGTTLNVTKDLLNDTLKNRAEKSNKKQIVFFISDGEITNGNKLDSFSNAGKYISNGAVLGYGTSNGGKMKAKDYQSSKEGEKYVKDKTTDYPYSDAVSVIDEDNLKQLAKDLNIDYIHMEKQSAINTKLKEIKNGIVNNVTEENKSSYVDIYYIFVIPLLILLVYEFIIYKRRL